MIERAVEESRASSVCELLESPVLQGGLFVVQEDTPVFHSGRSMRATRPRDE